MAQELDMIPVAELGPAAAALVQRVQVSGKPLMLSNEGQAAAIVLSVDAYRRAEHEREMLRLLVRGEREIAAGEGYDLDEVLGEADA